MRLRTGDTFRIQLKAVFGPGDESPWLDAGFWGAVTNRVTNRKAPTFDRGVLDTADIFYFVAFTFVFLFLTLRSVESRAWR